MSARVRPNLIGAACLLIFATSLTAQQQVKQT
jgi:hypothetical protein